jgi:hypothetical protein
LVFTRLSFPEKPGVIAEVARPDFVPSPDGFIAFPPACQKKREAETSLQNQ